MLAQYLAFLEATNLRELKTKSVKDVNSPRAYMEKTSHVHLLVESFCTVFDIYILRQSFRLSLVFQFALNFPSNLRLALLYNCFYKNRVYFMQLYK